MRIFIWDFTHDRYYPVLTSETTTIKNFLTQVVPQIIKDRGPGRQFVAYLQKTGEQLYVNEQGRFIKQGKTSRPVTLHPWQTMSSAGVIENEVLVLCYFIQPGALDEAINIDQRFAYEFKKLKELEASTDIVHIEAMEGSPPRKYRVTLKCKGMMVNPENNKLSLTANHVFEIDLPVGLSTYPYEAPYIRCLTPHFHPNISPENNIVCTGVERKWEPSLDLAWLVCHLVDIITYRYYGVEDPYNKEAAQWAEANRDKFPLDKRSIFKEPVNLPASQSGDDTSVSTLKSSSEIEDKSVQPSAVREEKQLPTKSQTTVPENKLASDTKAKRKAASTAKKRRAHKSEDKK